MQTLRVLQTICLPLLHVLSPYPSSHYLLKHHQNVSHVPQVLPYSRRSSLNSLGNSLNIHLQQQMGVFQASMLEAFQSLRYEFLSFKKTSKQPEVEVDQTSASASKPTTSSQAVILDPPHPRLRPTQITKVASVRPKKHSLSHKRHGTEPRPASDQYLCQFEEPRVVSSRPKKHADKRKYKVRSRYLSSSSKEDQSSAPKHRSSKPSGPLSDQDHPQHDPDPP